MVTDERQQLDCGITVSLEEELSIVICTMNVVSNFTPRLLRDFYTSRSATMTLRGLTFQSFPTDRLLHIEL
jgi:hypothetical protein